MRTFSLTAFAVLLAIGTLPALSEATKATETKKKDAYPLKTCVVSGEKLDAMGKPFVYQHKGQEVQLCCRDCLDTFLKSPEKYLAKIEMAKHPYPLTTCVVSGDKLDAMGKPIVYQHEGQEVRFCCKSCVKDFQKDPKRYLAMIQKAHAAKMAAGKTHGKDAAGADSDAGQNGHAAHAEARDQHQGHQH